MVLCSGRYVAEQFPVTPQPRSLGVLVAAFARSGLPSSLVSPDRSGATRSPRYCRRAVGQCVVRRRVVFRHLRYSYGDSVQVMSRPRSGYPLVGFASLSKPPDFFLLGPSASPQLPGFAGSPLSEFPNLHLTPPWTPFPFAAPLIPSWALLCPRSQLRSLSGNDGILFRRCGWSRYPARVQQRLCCHAGCPGSPGRLASPISNSFQERHCGYIFQYIA